MIGPASAKGHVAEMLKDQKIPPFIKIRQHFPDQHIDDVQAETAGQLNRPGTLDQIKPGEKIAVAVGSRGISDIALIVKTVLEKIRSAGAVPFIVPAMGSHGGATAEGQLHVLEAFGITEESMNCPVLSSMEAVLLGYNEDELPVYFDRNAYEADKTIIVNRIKPHTDFRGRYESGLMKMLTIGLGKQKGAEINHSLGMGRMARNVEITGNYVLQKGNVIFGLAVVENALDRTCRIQAIPSARIMEEEPALLELSRSLMPSILIHHFDVLIVDQIGKEISGNGMDPNITGSFAGPYASGGADKQKCAVLDITDASHGNGLGLGLADYSTNRVFMKFDLEATYPNVITNTTTITGKLPLFMANDLLAVKACIQTCNGIDKNNAKIVRLRNTLSLSDLYISQALRPEAEQIPEIEILSEPQEFFFDENGNLDLDIWNT